MLLAIDDYVYVNRKGLYGRIVNKFKEGEETFYTVEFPWDFIEDKDFEESQLVKLDSPYFPKRSIVTGLKGVKKYNFTTDKAIMEVMNNGNDGRMLVKILEHSGNFSYVGTEHWVDSMWFRHFQPTSNFVR